jgi:putative Mg2+ transporter-C (MgtC) family protein
MEWAMIPGGLHEVFFRLAAATLIGGVLGIDRKLRQKPAGLRTHALVSLGAALATLTSIGIAGSDSGAVTRGIQGVLAGVGFLGGGVILKGAAHHGHVRGLTTAASVWVVATLGVACGAGQWAMALFALALTLLVLIAGGPLERLLQRLVRRFSREPAPPPDGRPPLDRRSGPDRRRPAEPREESRPTVTR